MARLWLIAILFTTGAFAADPSGDDQYWPIFKSRIFLVPKDSSESARSLLADRKFVALDNRTLANLFPGGSFDEGAIAQAQQSAFLAEADPERCKHLNDATATASCARAAEDAKRIANYSATLVGRLHPYLFKTEVLNPGTGSFDVSWEGSYLMIRHGSLGRSKGPAQFVPLVIFLERAPEHVSVTERGAL